MNAEFYFSQSTNSFFFGSMLSGFEKAGTLPEDIKQIDSDIAREFMGTPPAGKVRVVIDGLPAWGEAPAPTKGEMIAQAEQKKSALRQVADSEIAWRQDAVDAEIATDEESAALLEWKKYRVLLMRVDTTRAPDINWPAEPKA